MKKSQNFGSKKFYLLLAFLLGVIPSILFTHVIAQDFTEYYTQTESLLTYNDYSFTKPVGYGTSESNLNARAPLLPFLMAISKFFVGDSMFAAYLPILAARVLIVPLAFLVSSFFLPVEIAFLAASMIVFFPKLQTFSLAAFEADGFVIIFYLLALFFYLHYKKALQKTSLIFSSISLGLLSLVKELGLPISLGFIAAVSIEQILNLSTEAKRKLSNIVIFLVPFLAITVPFFLYTLTKGGHLYFSALTVDRDLKHIPENLPFLFKTIPIYVGAEELSITMLSQKSFFVSLAIILCLFIGLFYSLVKKHYVLILPIIFTIFVLGLLNEIALGGKVAGNPQLISILAFMTPIASIMIFKGFLLIIDLFSRNLYRFNKVQNLIYFSLSLLLVFKFVNNFFAKPYILNDQNDRYVNLLTIVLDKEKIPPPLFERNPEGILMVSDLGAFDSFMSNVYKNSTVEVFSSELRLSLLTVLFGGIIYFYVNYLIKTLKNRIKN